jgi:hypothetical protein
MLNARTGNTLSNPVGKYREIRSTVDNGEPDTQLSEGAFPERYNAFLSALSVQVKSRLTVQQNIFNEQPGLNPTSILFSRIQE